MPQGNDFQFSLQTSTGEFWAVDASGNVDHSSTPYYLQYSPDGWSDVSIQNVRNKKYWGIDRSVTVPLAYVKDAARILKHIFYTLGIEEDCYLVIASQYLDYTAGVSYGYGYTQIYRGSVDLSTFNHAGAKVTCTTLEDGLPKFLKANENTVYEFDMNVPEAINVEDDGVILHNKVENFLSDGTSGGDPLYNYGNHLIDLTITEQDAPYVGGKKAVTRTKVSNSNSAIKATAGWFLSANVDSEIILDYDFRVQLAFSTPPAVNPAADFRIVVRRIDATGFSDLQSVLLLVPDTGFNGTYHVSGSTTIIVRPGDELYLYAFCDVEGAGGDDQLLTTYLFEDNSFFNYTYLYRPPASIVKAFTPQYLWSLLVNKFTEGNYSAATSSFFTTHSDKVVTSGNAIRGLTDATMKISVSTFFKFWDSFSSVGIIENSATIGFDEKVNLIDTGNVIALGEVGADSLKISVAKEYLFNELEIGYPELKNDVGVLNGNEEFNSKFLFSLGTTKSPAKLDKISPIKASCYEIEKIRLTTFDKNTTDYKADNDLFVLHIEDYAGYVEVFSSTEDYSITESGLDTIMLVNTGFGSSLQIGDKISIGAGVDQYYIKNLVPGSGIWNVYLYEHPATTVGTLNAVLHVYRATPAILDRTLNASATGLIEPDTVFNLIFSPKRMLLNNGGFIRSSLYLSDDKVLEFISADKNNKLECDGVIEKADETIGSIGDLFFYPILFDFMINAPGDLLDLLGVNPLQIFSFPFHDVTYKGILVKASVAPSNRKEQAYQLLSCADNDLTTLISNYGGG